MATEVVMPQMGESIAEGTITKWLVKVGDKVERDQPLFEISTDKVDAEIPSPAAGTVLEIRHKEGETVLVSKVVALIGETGEQPGAGKTAAAPAATPKQAEQPGATAKPAAAPAPGPSQPAAAGAGASGSAAPAKAAAPAASAATSAPAQPAAPAQGKAPAPAAPEGSFDYDLVIIGSGPGGYVAGIRAGQLGLKVAVVEKDPKLGGTCLHRGCIPTKALLHSAELLDTLRKAESFGVVAGEVKLDVAKAHEHKRGVVAKNAKGIEGLFKKYKVTPVLQGRGKLVDPHTVEITKNGGETQRISTRYVLIATGSVPREIGIAPSDGKRILNSDHLLELESVPKSLVVLGAGAVGTEFASIFRSFGSEVTIVEMLPRLLPVEDEESSAEVARAFRKRGIEAVVDAKVTKVETTDAGVKLTLEHKKKQSLEAEMLLVAIGRAPVTEGLGLEALGVEVERGYVKVVDGYMRTAVPHIYAIGDVVPNKPWLAHVASAEGIVAVEHMAGHETRPLDYRRVPGVTFCDPEVASVGLTEAKARELGYDVQVGKFPFTALGKAAIVGKTEGFVKIVREKKYDEVLGVHIVGVHATDLIGEACAALGLETTAEELFRAVHPHPTLSEAMAEAAHASHGSAIHF
jgi:dihydrolipoyl dehydrogenase